MDCCDCENDSEIDNFDDQRNIQLQHKSDYIRRSDDEPPNVDLETAENSLPEHMRDLYARTAEDRTIDQRLMIAEFLTAYADCFSKDDGDLGRCTIASHSIDTGDSVPLRQPPRRAPLAFAHEEKSVIENLEKQGVIRKSTSVVTL